MAALTSIFQAGAEFVAMRPPGGSHAGYAAAVRGWFEWCANNGIDPLHARRIHIEKYRRYLVDQTGHKESTATYHVIVVCGLYRYAHIEGLIDADPGEHVFRGGKARYAQSDWYTRDELQMLLNAAESDRLRASWALVGLLGLVGMRIGEVMSLRVEDIGTHGDQMTLSIRKRKLSQGHRISVSSTVEKAVIRARGKRQSGPLLVIPHRKGTYVRARPDLARVLLHRLSATAGVKYVSPHGLRHTFITLARDARIPDRDIMAATGHVYYQSLIYYDRAASAVERNASAQLESWLEL